MLCYKAWWISWKSFLFWRPSPTSVNIVNIWIRTMHYTLMLKLFQSHHIYQMHYLIIYQTKHLIFKNGSSTRTRTWNNRINSSGLLPLSYAGIWRSWPDSNWQHLPWQGSALTNCATRPHYDVFPSVILLFILLFYLEFIDCGTL